MKLKTHVGLYFMLNIDEGNSWPEDYNWKADQYAAVQTIDFSTDTKPCGLLGACRNSRAEILRVYCGAIKGQNDKIFRFDGENDTILLHGKENASIQKPLLGK